MYVLVFLDVILRLLSSAQDPKKKKKKKKEVCKDKNDDTGEEN